LTETEDTCVQQGYDTQARKDDFRLADGRAVTNSQRHWVIFSAWALVVGGLRASLVWSGLLYGAGRIITADVAISIFLILVLAAQMSGKTKNVSPGAGAQRSWGDRVGVVAAVLGFPALIASVLSLVAPPTPPGVSAAACAGTQTYSTAYLGVTLGPLGDFARNGPGVSFAQTDRLDKDCTVGFEGYCIGDPVDDPYAKGWVDTRWLLVSTHSRQPWKEIAHLLSGEPSDDRFVSLAYVAPKSPDRQLNYLGPTVCQGGRPQPGRTSLAASAPAASRAVTFTAQAAETERIGLAVYVPSAALSQGSSIRKMESAPTDIGGVATITWQAKNTLDSLTAKRTGPITVVVLAVPCLGPDAPADADVAATRTYSVATDGTLRETAKPPAPAPNVVDSLRRAACDSDQLAGQSASF
jgi:hypothetical protein